MSVLTPDRPVMTPVSIFWSIRAVQDASDDHEEPGNDCKDLVGYQSTLTVGFSFPERVQVVKGLHRAWC